MEIKLLNKPLAGQYFHFLVTGGLKPIRIRASVHGKTIFEEMCPDPPCHQKMTVPINANNSDIEIEVWDAAGIYEKQIVKVQTQDDTNSGGMTMGA